MSDVQEIISDACDEVKYCKACRYSLVGLNSNRCPECGKVFDLSNPNTFLTQAELAKPVFKIEAFLSLAWGIVLSLFLPMTIIVEFDVYWILICLFAFAGSLIGVRGVFAGCLVSRLVAVMGLLLNGFIAVQVFSGFCSLLV